MLFYKDNEIIRFEAKNKKTAIHFIDNTLSEIAEPIGSIESQLKNHGFIRIHSNHLVNVNHITGIPNQSPGFIELNKSQLLPISTEQHKIIIQLISTHLKM